VVSPIIEERRHNGAIYLAGIMLSAERSDEKDGLKGAMLVTSNGLLSDVEDEVHEFSSQS